MPQQINEDQVKNLTTDLAAKAPLASPALTGIPTAPTATAGTNTTQIATTAFVEAAIAGGTSGITQLTGDVTAGPGSGSQAATLAASGVTAGSYGNPTAISVDSKGRVTSINGGSSVYQSSYVASAFAKAPSGTTSISATIKPGGPQNTVVVWVPMENLSDYTNLTLSDGGGHTWTLVNNPPTIAVFVSSGISDSSITVTAHFSSPTGGAVALALQARTGVLTPASPYDAAGSFYTYFGASSSTTNTATTTNANDVLLAFGYGNGSGTPSVTGTGWITDVAQSTSGALMTFGSQIVAATGTYSGTISFTAGQPGIIASIVALKLAGTGGANTTMNGVTGAVTIAGGIGTNVVTSGSTVTVTAPVMVGDTGSGGAAGIVPAPAAGDAAAGKFLKADGTFAVPTGAGGITLTTTGTSGAATLSGGTLNIPVYSSSGGGAMTKLAETILSSAAATVTFSSIPNGYRNLVLRITARCTVATNAQDSYMQFNGDTGANYTRVFFNANGATTSTGGNVSVSQAPAIWVAGSTATANLATSASIRIYDYARSVWIKNAIVEQLTPQTINTGSSGIFPGLGSFVWNNTAVIASVTMGLTTSGNFATGSVFTLYGES